MSKVIYSCAENELKICICSNNGNTLGCSLAKAYTVYISDLFVHQQNYVEGQILKKINILCIGSYS